MGFLNSVIFLNGEALLKHEEASARRGVATLWEGTAKDQRGTHKRTSGQVRQQDVNLWSWSTSRKLWPRRNSPMGKLLKAFIGDGPFCSSGVVWGMTFSRKDFMAGWWSDCCWDGGVCCFTSRFGSSWRDGCIICCCTLRGRPLKRQDACEKPEESLYRHLHAPSLLNSLPSR